jgi:hypothetical protein
MPHVYAHRTAFGAWINDMRNAAMPNERWPHVTVDDRTVDDVVACLDLQQRAGFNEFDVFGLIASYAWPTDLATAVDPGRRRKIDRIIDAAHQRGIKLIYGLGVYSWGFDRIIEADPRVQGTNPHAMCGSKAASWEWMSKVVDYVLSEFAVDGFHLESSDQGRCACAACAPLGDVEYHCRLNTRTAEYVRSRWPDKILMVNMCGYMPWGTKAKPEELGHLADLGKRLDYLIDPGHAGFFVDERDRRGFVAELACDFGTSGGIWVYPPQRWERLRWFLPYTRGTGRHIRQLYDQGGRAVEYYMGPILNPGVEANVLFGGRMLSDASREPAAVLREVLDELYRPKTEGALDGLVLLFERAERAYFDNWAPQMPDGRERPGELHLTPLFATESGPATYVGRAPYRHGRDGAGRSYQMMGPAGRAAYRRELQALGAAAEQLVGTVGAEDRLRRIQTCLRAAIADLDAAD